MGETGSRHSSALDEGLSDKLKYCDQARVTYLPNANILMSIETGTRLSRLIPRQHVKEAA